METLLDKVKKCILENNLIKKGETVIAAFSGGADSSCLVHILSKLSGELGFTLCAAHLNHMLRAEEAERDQQYVMQFCSDLDISLKLQKKDIAQIAQHRRISLEEAGRFERYEWLRTLSEDFGGALIATAHHKDDNAETILLNILRGSGLDGLIGILPKRENIIRPLIHCTRDEIEAYCRENQIEFVTDSTNLEAVYTRNRLRLQLMPMLKEFNPAIRDALIRLSECAHGDSVYIEAHAKQAFDETVIDGAINVQKLRKMDCAISYRILSQCVKVKFGITLQKKHVDLLYQLIQKGKTGSRLSLPGGIWATISYDLMHFETACEKPSKYIFELSAGEEINIFPAGLTIKTHFGKCSEVEENTACIVAVEGKITVRTRKEGDNVSIRGMTKKLKKLLIEKKVPRKVRDILPVVEVDGKIVLVADVFCARECTCAEKYLIVKAIKTKE